MRATFDNVFLLTHEITTGGPEAMHQLGHQINHLGGRAQMAYCGPYSHTEIADGMIRCDAANSPAEKYFAHYQPQVLRAERLGPQSLVIYAEIETMAALAPAKADFSRAIWWLSVDNAITKNPRILDSKFRQALFGDPRIVHFYQSAYAHAFLKSAGAASCHPLSDYTDPQFIARAIAASDPPTARRENILCFFPHKGGTLAKQFIERDTLRNRAQLVPIHGMSKAQVRETLFRARIYIDFGHHPGKDRVPREAAIAGAVILLHAMGAANYFADHSLAPEYLFTGDDVASGILDSRIDAILNDPQPHLDAQRDYRASILREYENFENEVRAFFLVSEDNA